MEIKVGEYIRTIDGYIRKATQVEAEDTIPIVVDEPVLDDDTKWRNCYQVMECVDVERITKHSPNIIDLIEVGDYVNGCLIVEINKDQFIKGQINLWTNMIMSEGEPFSNEYYKAKIIEKDIKSIVTKEQFAEMEYKL